MIQSPSDLILSHLRAHHRGKARAITREDLRRHLQDIGQFLSDRDLRELVHEHPDLRGKVCSCAQGYFIAVCKAETDEAIEYQKKKIFPLWKNTENIKLAYPEFYDERQGELFRQEGI